MRDLVQVLPRVPERRRDVAEVVAVQAQALEFPAYLRDEIVEECILGRQHDW